MDTTRVDNPREYNFLIVKSFLGITLTLQCSIYYERKTVASRFSDTQIFLSRQIVLRGAPISMLTFQKFNRVAQPPQLTNNVSGCSSRPFIPQIRLEVAVQCHAGDSAVSTACVLLADSAKFSGGGCLFCEDCSGNGSDIFFPVVGVFQKGWAP
jgi:hypothetical protein